jgi:hypothetical protein
LALGLVRRWGLRYNVTSLNHFSSSFGRNSDGSIRIYQLPSERSALGRVRFNFPNQFLVYQHDTPDKYLFSKPARAYSHGCMRVEYPDKYAETLLSISQPEEGYTVQRIRSLYGRGERNINLKNPIPVYLTYQTVFFDDAGQVQTRPDIYGLDKNVTALLKGEPSVADLPVTRRDSPVRAHATLRHRYEIVEQPYSWDRSWDPIPRVAELQPITDLIEADPGSSLRNLRPSARMSNRPLRRFAA